MDYENLLYKAEGPVVTIVWNRPETLNAMSEALMAEFRDALRTADRDPGAKVVVFKGAGRAFSTGGDFGEEAPGGRDARTGLPDGMDVGEYMMRNYRLMQEWNDDYLLLADMALPVICQVHGWCLGGGALLAVAADLTIASDDAVFALPEIRQGLPGGIVWALVAHWKDAMRYCLTGDHLDAAEALRIGLVNEVVPRDQLDERVSEITRRLALIPREALESTKQMIRRGMDEMGYRNAVRMAADQSGWLFAGWRHEIQGEFERIAASDGIAAAVRHRDGPFWPEPFGPMSKRARVDRAEEGAHG